MFSTVIAIGLAGSAMAADPHPYCPNNIDQDLNCNGIIDIVDIVIVAIHFGETDP